MSYKSRNEKLDDPTSPYNDPVWRAKMSSWCRKHGFRPIGYSEAWLDEYELQNGYVFPD